LTGGSCGFGVPNFTHEDNVWTLAQRAAQSLCEAWCINAHLALREQTSLIGEKIFDRILNRHDVTRKGLIHRLEAGCQRSALSGAGWSTNED
jgi:hypothetical protein